MRNYYGKGRFTTQPGTSLGSASSRFRDINFEDLVDDKNQVWRADTVNPFSSFRSRYDSETRTSSQSCTAVRAVDDNTNFMIKVGSYKFLTGYRIFKSSENISEQQALFSGESDEIVALFERGVIGLAPMAASTLAILITFQWF